MAEHNFYVYVYIDPRNHEEFYYGKGKGSRRSFHLKDGGDSEKTNRIRAIQAEKLQPIIRTIATGLSAEDAHLIETTLIWKLGRRLTNEVAGRFSKLFRPHDTIHRELARFDFQNDVYYFNVCEGKNRNWEDCRRLGFLAAGQGARWRDQICDLVEGDVVVAYIKGRGYAGVGKVASRAVRYLDFRCKGQPLHAFNLAAPKMQENADSNEKSEYVLGVHWKAAVAREQCFWERSSGLFTSQLVRASLSRQPKTIKFVNKAFDVDLWELSK